MTRRFVVFTDAKTNKTYRTPEFNGDRAEYLLFKGTSCLDSCSAEWNDIYKEFEEVTTLEQFEAANVRAQGYYSSFLGVEVLPIEEYAIAGPNIVNETQGKCSWYQY